MHTLTFWYFQVFLAWLRLITGHTYGRVVMTRVFFFKAVIVNGRKMSIIDFCWWSKIVNRRTILMGKTRQWNGLSWWTDPISLCTKDFKVSLMDAYLDRIFEFLWWTKSIKVLFLDGCLLGRAKTIKVDICFYVFCTSKEK